MINSLLNLAVIFCTAFGLFFWFKSIKSKSYLNLPANWAPIGLVDVLIGFVATLVLPIFAISIWMVIWQATKLEELSSDHVNVLFATRATVNLIACVAVAIFLSIKYKDFQTVLVPKWQTVPSHAKTAATAFSMVFPLLLLLQWILSFFETYSHETINQLTSDFKIATVVITWFSAVLVAPICEEFFFRGILQSWLQRIRLDGSSDDMVAQISGGPDSRWNKNNGDHLTQLKWWLPIVISSVFFVLVHEGLARIPLFFFSLALGCVYRKTGSILPAILLHFMLNAFSMFRITIGQVVELLSDKV